MQDINITFALMKVFILLKKNDLKDLYEKYTKGKEQKFGDKIEIKLFGEVKYFLTIKEALFILNKDNYCLSSEELKNKFLKCNEIKLDQLLNKSLIELLSNLGINIDYLQEDDKNTYNYPLKKGNNITNKYFVNKPRYPECFYYDINVQLDKFFEMLRSNNDNRK